MQIVQKSKRVLSILLITILCFGLLAAVAAPAQAVQDLPETFYMEQSRGGICTMVSSAMLLRSALYLNGDSRWEDISESVAASACWIWGIGLAYDWSYEADDISITVGHTDLYGVSVEELKALLDAHPEGIVFYCGGVPHAVLLTDYEDDTFYCADPAPYCSGSRVALSDSWLGYRLGSQENILRCATAYWSITDSNLEALSQTTEDAPVTVTAQKAEIQETLGTTVTKVNAPKAMTA